MIGTAMPSRSSPSTMAGTAAAAASLLTVTRTSSLPARASVGDLLHRGGHVGGVGVGHRLDDDRMIGPDPERHRWWRLRYVGESLRAWREYNNGSISHG